jgi:hypothetical protein
MNRRLIPLPIAPVENGSWAQIPLSRTNLISVRASCSYNLFTRSLQKTDALVATRSWPAGNIRGGQVSISS